MKKILIVDDERDILEALNLILEGEGFFVQTSSTTEETLQRLIEFNPDLIILDVLLSGEDGRTLCKQIKSTPHFSKIPVLMMSAHLSAKDSSFDMGADSFLAKPFDIPELLEKINQL